MQSVDRPWGHAPNNTPGRITMILMTMERNGYIAHGAICKEDTTLLRINRPIIVRKCFQDPIETRKKRVHTAWDNGLIRPGLNVSVRLIYRTTLANRPGNLCKGRSQLGLVLTVRWGMKICSGCVNQLGMITTTRLQIHYSTLDHFWTLWHSASNSNLKGVRSLTDA